MRDALACECGFARTGVPPRQLCEDCTADVVARWLAEERNLLRTLPEEARRVEDLLAEAAAAQERALSVRNNEPLRDAQHAREAAGRKISRGWRARGRSLGEVQLAAWTALGELATTASSDAVRVAARDFAKRGLGAAGIAGLALEATELIARRYGD